ncbi:hypothetical protein BH09SUM1_BH09SUM1_31320 [soil metagenome]
MIYWILGLGVALALIIFAATRAVRTASQKGAPIITDTPELPDDAATIDLDIGPDGSPVGHAHGDSGQHAVGGYGHSSGGSAGSQP